MEKSEGRSRLAAVLRGGRALITVDDATRALGSAAALASTPGDQVVEDPWTLIPELFGVAYVGGASAAHHWDLTEQLFRSVFVCTVQPVRRKTHSVHGTTFILRHVSADRLFGTRALWRGRTKLQVSDPHRTVIDMLDDPASGGGIRHVADCLQSYPKRADASAETLVEYAARTGNGAVFKRLGFLAERAGAPNPLIVACAGRLTMGNAKLDPALSCPRLIRPVALVGPRELETGGRR